MISRLFMAVTTVLTAIAASALPVAAREARLALDPQLAESASGMPVDGANPRRWGTNLSFGDYRAVEVRDGDHLEWFFAVGNFGTGAAKSASRLTLEGPSGALRVECLAKRKVLARGSFSVDLALGRKPLLMCGLEGPDGDRWTLVLTERAPNLTGTIQPEEGIDGARLDVRSVHRLEGSKWPLAEPAGYEISEGGRVVAAIETINRGRVWIGSDLDADTRQRVAAVAAALLLFEPPEVESEP